MGFYYLKKFSDNLKFAVGVKSLDSIDNRLIFICEKKIPNYLNLKFKIDTSLNACMTVRNEINESLAFMYGIGLSNMFQRHSRVQTGFVLEYNAWFRKINYFIFIIYLSIFWILKNWIIKYKFFLIIFAIEFYKGAILNL